MARILAVFEFTVELREIRKALGDEHEILHAHDLAEARQWARAGSIDLVIASTGLKDSDPGYLWVVLGKLVGQGAPFIFIKDPAVQRSLPSATVLNRPLAPKALLEAVDFALKNRKREEGEFHEGGLDKILARIQEDEQSGVLTAYYDKLIKRVVCTRGRVSFCGSNDPSELVGQAFVRSGLISEKDLMEAIAVQDKTAEPLGKVLQALRKVTQEQVKRTIADKFREAVLDLYLWTEGRWVFQREGGFERAPAEELQIDIGELRTEGKRRADRWTQLLERLPSHTLRFKVRLQFADLGPEPTWVERRVLSLARAGGSLGDMVMEVRGQEFPVYDFVVKMLDCGAFQLADDEPDVDEPLLRALEPESDGPNKALVSTRESDAPAHSSRRPPTPDEGPPSSRAARVSRGAPPPSARSREAVRARPDPRRESLAGFAAVREVPSLEVPRDPRPSPAPDEPPHPASRRDAPTDAPGANRKSSPKPRAPTAPREDGLDPEAGLSRDEVGAALRLISQGQPLADAVKVTVRETNAEPEAPRTTIRDGGKPVANDATARSTLREGRKKVDPRAEETAEGPRLTLREGRGAKPDQAESTVRPGKGEGRPTKPEGTRAATPDPKAAATAKPVARAEPDSGSPDEPDSGPPSEPFGVVRAPSHEPVGLAAMLEPEGEGAPGFDLGNLIQETLERPVDADDGAAESLAEEPAEGDDDRPSMDPTSKALLTEAREAKMAGDLDSAMQTLRYVLIIDPLNAHARREMDDVEELQKRGVEKLGVTAENRVRLAIDLPTLANIALSPEEAFILTRLAAEPMRVRDLMAICPMDEHDTLKLVAAHVESKHVEIVD